MNEGTGVRHSRRGRHEDRAGRRRALVTTLTLVALVSLLLVAAAMWTQPGRRDVTLLSQDRPATASSVGSTDTGPENAVDGGPRTRWESAAGPDAQGIQVDLGAPRRVRRVLVSWQRRAP